MKLITTFNPLMGRANQGQLPSPINEAG